MDSDSMQDKPVSIEKVNSHEVEAESNNFGTLEVATSAHELESVAEILTKVELDLARSSEKLANMDMLFIHVASRENDFEVFALEEEQRTEGPAVKASEFDLLYGIFDSEIKELESFLFVLQSEIVSLQKALSSFRKLSDGLMEMEERFQGCEDSLKWCFEQVSDMKAQSANFKRILVASGGDEKCKDGKELGGLGNGDLSDINVKMKVQTAEQQRNILRMLEKSLAREMDLERKLTDSRQNEEDLQIGMQQLLFCMEVEAEYMWARLFEAENRADVLLEISKELLGQSQIQNSLEKNMNFELKVTEAEKRARTAEAECKLLRESTMKRAQDTTLLKCNITDASEKVERLGRLLKESEIKRQHVVVAAVASEKKQGMLECTTKEMENLTKDLKSKALTAEHQTEIAEEKCILLLESNAELTEETNFLRHKIQQLETSLHRADKTKKDAANDIRVQSKFIADLALQLAFEREHLHKQISSLAKEKEIAIMNLQQMKDPLATVSGSCHAKVKEPVLADNDDKNGTPRNACDGETNTSYENGNACGDLSINEINTGDADSSSNLDRVRNIDARQLKFKYVLMAVVAFGIPILVVYLFQQWADKSD